MARALADLLQTLPGIAPLRPNCAPGNIAIAGVTADSRLVQPGWLFVALRGATVDGHEFIPKAVAQGASAVVGAAEIVALPPIDVPYVRVSDARAALATLAAAFHGFPSRRLRLIGVTGTDGKTTTCNLIYRMLLSAGWPAGMISTIGARIGREAEAEHSEFRIQKAAGRMWNEEELDTGLHVTTPDAPDVQRYLGQMVEAGCAAAILETTSHGLHQGRVAACDFDVAVVTNVTHEHLDYHGSWEAYLAAKALLFHSLATASRKTDQRGVQPKVAVLNADDRSYQALAAIPAERQLSYGLETAHVDLTAEQITHDADRTRFLARTPAGAAPVETRLIGRFNVYNCLAAIGAGLAVGLPLEAITQGIASLAGVSGRMERIDCGQGFLALVDFAHTPVSLARALEAARPMTPGRLVAVFGSAGLRDVEKRSLMAETALRLADYTVLTAEDPRTESLETILAQMAEGAERAGGREGQDFARIPDRVAAIQWAVDMAQPGDTLLICGKGHERSMCFGALEHPWSDQAVLAWALERRLGLTEDPPPYRLPTAAH